MKRSVYVFPCSLLLIVALIGEANGNGVGFLLDTGGTFTTFAVPGSTNTEAHGINDRGEIVGFYTDAITGRDHGFLYSGGTFTTVDPPGSIGTLPMGINAAGQIVGIFFGPSGGGSHGFLDTGGTFTTIDVPGSVFTEGRGINAPGQIVGRFEVGDSLPGFLYTGGTFTTIDVPLGPFPDGAFGINARGQIVGNFEDATGHEHGYLDTAGMFTQLDVPGSVLMQAWGINDSGKIVGRFVFSTSEGYHGFLDTDGTFTQLDVPGGVGTQAFGINNRGQIVGTFITTTVPEPSTWLLLGSGFAGLILWRKRQIWHLVIALSLAVATPVFAVPMTFDIATQPQFGTFVSGHLTFDPIGVYFAGPFDISVGAIELAPPSPGLPATQFTDLNTQYVVQPNTSFHSLWVQHFPFDQLFLFIGRDSCSGASCIFEMTYYQSPCSDCPVISRVQGAIFGTFAAVPEPSTWLLLGSGLVALAFARRRKLAG